jgi:hypothetical protein
MGDHVKEINEYYVILLHVYLGTVQATIAAVADPAPDPPPSALPTAAQLRLPPALPPADLEKLNSLYAS